jgi:hypothetical protein
LLFFQRLGLLLPNLQLCRISLISLDLSGFYCN